MPLATLADLDPGTAKAAPAVVMSEIRRCRKQAEKAADIAHDGAEKMARFIERGVSTEPIVNALATLRSIYTLFDTARDMLDKEGC